MKKLLAIIFSLAILSGCAANENTEVSETSGTSETSTASVTAEKTETTTVTTETTAEITAEAAEYSQNVQDMARTFAKLVYEELENNKTAENPTIFHPISVNREISETGFDPDAFEADIFFIDTDLDGVPELFTGSHGTSGSGRYTVYTADGSSYGNEIFAHYFDGYCIVDGCMYAHSGSTTFGGWTKLCDNLPTIFCNGFLSDEEPNNMTLRYADGSEENFDRLTYDEVMELYRKYLNVEFDELKFTDRDEDIPFIYTRGVLEVPDPENYTEEDIYNCLAGLLAEYEKSAGTIPFGTEEKIPTNEELGVNADGTLNDAFTKRIEQLMEPHRKMAMGSVFPTLWDFDEDGVPEIILIFHSGNQGSMPCEVYDPKTLEQIGEFEGFCRDGFTRFVNGYDVGTVIYNYYEHSNWQRVETVNFVTIQNRKLVSKKKITRNWQTGDNMIKAAMVVYSDNSEEANHSEQDFLDYNFGTVCTSYGNFDIDVTDRAAAVVESYNNYIKVHQITKEEYPVGCAFIGLKNEAAVYEVKGEGFFRDENGVTTPLNNDWPYSNIYKLDEDIIVCQQFGNTHPCDVYIITDGKPVLDEKISGQGHAMLLSRSKLYNGRFEITESVYDATSFGSHTFKTYQLYRDENGFHEYGSIVVPIEDFNKYYGEAAQVFVDDIAEKRGVNGVSVDIEIYEVLYRSDNSFILNCQSPLIAGEYDNDTVGYNFYNITLKPTTDGGLAEVYRDRGVYKTALIPEIAVYPEKMYIPETEE